MTMRIAPILIALFAATASAHTLVVLPFESVGGADDGVAVIESLIAETAAARGWNVVPPATVAPVLEKGRVRYLDSLTDDARKAVLDASGAEAIVSGVVFDYAAGRNAAVAFAVRLMRPDGTLAWSTAGGLTADDTQRAFGFGRRNDVADVARAAVTALLRDFPTTPTLSRNAAERGRRPGEGLVSYRSADLDLSRENRVCILPLENGSSDPDAARVVGDLLALRLDATRQFDVVPPAVLRAAALKVGVASFRRADSAMLARLAPLVGTTLFLRGSVGDYHDPVNDRSARSAALAVELTLVDVQSGRVLWTAQHERAADDYAGLLMRGTVSTAVALADRVVAEMVDAASAAQNHRRNR